MSANINVTNPKNIAFIGYGQVGGALADHLERAGHTVVLAARDPNSESVRRLLEKNPKLKVASPEEAVKSAEVVFLATPFAANMDALEPVASALGGKILVDCTNPVGRNLSHGLESKQSGTTQLQAAFPDVRVVKAFTIYGFENFEDSAYPNYTVKPAMMIAGDDVEAKKTVGRLCEELGWEPVDTGNAADALHLEHMTLLWIKMARVQGKGSGFVWAMLRR